MVFVVCLFSSITYKLVQLLHIVSIKRIHFIPRVVGHGHNANDAIYINPLAISMVILIFVSSKVFTVVLQHHFNVEIVRILFPIFFHSSQKVH